MGGKILSFQRVVNGISIDQRKVDGFINATAMCVAHGKNISDWLKTSDPFEFCVALAADLNLLSQCDNSIDNISEYIQSVYGEVVSARKYVEVFPQLVVHKHGQIDNYGGTWLHPELALYCAQWCSKPFAIQVSRWVLSYLSSSQNSPSSSDFSEEWIALSQRYDIRIDLRDNLRPELMNATVCYAQSHGISPIRLCSSVHDTMNERIQGHKSGKLKQLGGLPLGDLLRDYFDVSPLQTYSAINKLALNAIEDQGVEPVAAVHDACDRYLGTRYIAKPFPTVENLHQSMANARATQRRIKAAKPQQLGLFDQAS